MVFLNNTQEKSLVKLGVVGITNGGFLSSGASSFYDPFTLVLISYHSLA